MGSMQHKACLIAATTLFFTSVALSDLLGQAAAETRDAVARTVDAEIDRAGRCIRCAQVTPADLIGRNPPLPNFRRVKGGCGLYCRRNRLPATSPLVLANVKCSHRPAAGWLA
jgi:hypothetical protein